MTRLLLLLLLVLPACAMSHEAVPAPPPTDAGADPDSCTPAGHHCQIGACHGCAMPSAPAPFDARHVDVSGWAPR